MELRHRFATILAPILMLGVGVLMIYLAGLGVEAISPGFMSKPGIGGFQALVGLIILLILLFIGMYLGFFVWLLCMKPFFKREELIPYISPYIPVITTMFLWLFNIVFPER
ncbi:MAG: hypothetical protein ACKVRN_02560 [Pyrinomonadaceae bacterium]